MSKSVPLPLYLLVAITLLFSLAPPASAQPAPNPCPEGQVFQPDQNLCVPEDEIPADDGNIPPEPPEGPVEPAGNLASLTLFHLACDNDFQADAVRDAGGIGPANGCHTFGKPPFTYTIAANDVPITTATLDATERNYAWLEVPSPVPAGTLTIIVSPVEGYTTELVSCVLSIGDGFGEIVEPSIAGGSATLTTEPDQDIECWVYNVNRETEAGDSGGVIADPPDATGADVTISAYLCPAGVTATDDLTVACNQRASGLEFSLVTVSDTVATMTSDAEGDVFFPEVVPNDYGIAAILPAGYGTPIVMCYHAFANGVVEEGVEDIVFGNQFRFTVFGDGESLECAWYNVPAQGADSGPNIFIEARTCSPGTSISTSMTVFDAQGVCPDFYIDLEYQVLNVDQVLATGRTNVESSSAGQVFFTKLPEPDSGGYGVTAGVREGERTLAVFCDQDFGDGTFQIIPVRVSGDRLDQELGMGAGNTMRCTWFIEMNPLMVGTHAPDAPAQQAAPEEAGDETDPGVTGSGQTLVGQQEGQASPEGNADEGDTESGAEGETGLSLLTLSCPPEAAGSDVGLDELCTEPASGLTFEVLVDDEPIGTLVTDVNGDLPIPADAAPGMYLFRHQPAADQLELRTECNSIYPNGATATGRSSAVGSQMGEIYLSYDGASRVTCTFYFVMESAPPQTGDTQGGSEAATEDEAADQGDIDGGNTAESHSLTLQFWACPAGVDPASDRDSLTQSCSVETSDRSFMLTIDGHTTGETITGPTTWEFNGGTVDADLGIGPISSVWCDSTWTSADENAAETQDEVTLNGNALTVAISNPGTTVSCDWFIFSS